MVENKNVVGENCNNVTGNGSYAIIKPIGAFENIWLGRIEYTGPKHNQGLKVFYLDEDKTEIEFPDAKDLLETHKLLIKPTIDDQKYHLVLYYKIFMIEDPVTKPIETVKPNTFNFKGIEL